MFGLFSLYVSTPTDRRHWSIFSTSTSHNMAGRGRKRPAHKKPARGHLRIHITLISLDGTFYYNPRDAETNGDSTDEEESDTSAEERDEEEFELSDEENDDEEPEPSAEETDEEESAPSADETDEEESEASAEAMYGHTTVTPSSTPPVSPAPEASPVSGASPVSEASSTPHWHSLMPRVSPDLVDWLDKSGEKYVQDQTHARTTEEVNTTSEDAVAVVAVLELINQDPGKAEELIDALNENSDISDDWLVARIRHSPLAMETIRAYLYLHGGKAGSSNRM
jgi:hypothetical protein